VANKFIKPTEVQARSLVYLNAHTDMVIAAKTGQGKTLTFGIPILDLLLRRLLKPGHEDDEFDSIKSLIMSPTRELAIQIKEHIEAIIPAENSKQIKICAIVGGMSIQKQLRLIKYKPTIIVATPGRLWELMSDH
jgi:ATP-dependent RNA helicase DDX24/MAK5